MTIAYLTSQYGRAGDTFIRGEVEHLRILGFAVETFSVRAPSERELVSDVILRERRATEDILGAGLFSLIGSALLLAISRPKRFGKATNLAIRIGYPGFRGRLWPMAYLVEACLLARRMQAKGVDHLHNHLGQNSAAVAMLASVLSGIPYSLTIHGPSEFDTPLTLALKEKIAQSRFTVAISDFGRSQLMRWSAAKHWPKIYVIRCGLPSDFELPTATAVPDVPRIVYVARFVEEKGHLVLIAAIARLAKAGKNVELCLVGDGPLRTVIEMAIAQNNAEQYIKLLGWKSSKDVLQIIESSRGFVLPSFAEGLPVSLMEAMALARPVVGTNVGAVSELVENGRHGWLVPAGSVESLTAAIGEMLDAPVEVLTKMGSEGSKRVIERHNARLGAQRLASLFMGSV